MIAEVIVDIAHSDVDKVFDYIADDDISLGFRVEVPFGRYRSEGFVVAVKERSEVDSGKLKKIIKKLDDFPVLSESQLRLAEFIKREYHVPFASALRQFIPSDLRGGRVKEKIISFAVLNGDISPIDMVASLRKGSTAQANAIGYLKGQKREKLALLNEKFGRGAIRSLVEKGFIKTFDEKADRVPYRRLEAYSKNVELSDEQSNAINSVLSADKKISLLFGVTGSGKTEVYLRLIDRYLQEGKTAIMLVPEIALTPQMLGQLRARFKDNVSILHSGLSAGERYDEWVRLRTGGQKSLSGREALFSLRLKTSE